MEITLSRGAASLTEQGSRAEGAAAVAARSERFGCCCSEKSKKRRKNKKAAFSSSLPAKTFAQAGRHLIQKCPLGTVRHGIMQGQGCCGSEPGASREQPWCWGRTTLQRMHSAAQTTDALWIQLPQGIFLWWNHCRVS